MSIFSRVFARRARKRSYDAAKVVARFGDFSRSGASANAELDLALPTLRNRARGLYRNDPFVRRWVSQLQVNVVGHTGFKLQVRAKNSNGGMDTFGNQQVETAWREWTRVCTADGQMSFRDALSLAVRTWARDGEVFCEIVRGPQFTHGMALHFFEADHVDETHNVDPLPNGNTIRQGIELDRFERPVAYHILRRHPGDPMFNTVEHRKYRRIPASKMIHVYIKDRPHQVRGEPPMSPIMTATKMLGGYREAEVTGRRLAASKMGFFKRLFNQGQGDLAPLVDVENSDGEFEIEVSPGKLSVLPTGVDFEKFDMTSFSTDYEQFERQILRSIAAGLDTAYSNITMDSSNSSYSADRSDQIKQRDVWRMMQGFFIERFANRVYFHWNDMAFQFAGLQLPMYRAEKFLKAAYFTPRGWSWVDPEKEIKATVLAMDRNITSLTRVATEQGRDVEDVFREIQSERELAKSYQIDLRSTDEKKLDASSQKQ